MEILEIIIWPLTVAFSAFLFKKPIASLIGRIKGVEYNKNKDGSQIKATFLEAGLADVKQKLEIPNTDKSQQLQSLPDPKLSILEAYSNLEHTAEKKLAELNQKDFKGSPLSYLEHKGSFTPNIESALQDIRMLRNQVAHYASSDIREEDAKDYLSVIKKIEKVIDALDSLPAMHLHAITMIVRNLSVILDANKYTEISIHEIHKHIEDGTVLDFLASLDESRELKAIMETGLYKGFVKFYVQSLQSIYHAYAGDERRKWGIEKSGICLLLAWTNEIIQMGSGWHPTTNLSELD